METRLKTCDECGDHVEQLLTLGRKECCYDCHLNARSDAEEQARDREWLDQF